MNDTFKIIWSRRAYNNLGKIIRYLEENWTEKEIRSFSVELERCLKIIGINPETFPNSILKPKLRKVVINKQNTLYYSVENNTVKLVNIFDTRQDPKKIIKKEDNNLVNEPAVPYNQRYENEGYTDWEIYLLNKDPFSSRFSLLADNLWKQDLKNLLFPWGIEINSTSYRMDGTRNGKSFHFDVFGRSDQEIIITCIREHLTIVEIAEFEQDLVIARDIYKNEPDKPIYGAVAFITADGSSDRMAQNLGFFVIKATGSSSAIINEPGFKPKAF